MTFADEVRTIGAVLPPPYGTVVKWAAPVIAVVLVVVAVAAVVATVWLSGRAHGVAAEKPKVVAAQTQATTAEAQAGLNTQAAQIPAAAEARSADILAQAERTARAIETLKGAPGAVPADVLDDWAAGVDGVRAEADRARAAGGPGHPGGAGPAGPVPAAGPAGGA